MQSLFLSNQKQHSNEKKLKHEKNEKKMQKIKRDKRLKGEKKKWFPHETKRWRNFTY